MNMVQPRISVGIDDLEEDCRTLLGVASMGVELGATDHAITIADCVAKASPNLREAHFAAVLFRLLDGRVDEAVHGAAEVRRKFPQWTTARILHALVLKCIGDSAWQSELNAVVEESDEETDIEFARALLSL